jgi:tRNA(adenine34) deaminase
VVASHRRFAAARLDGGIAPALRGGAIGWWHRTGASRRRDWISGGGAMSSDDERFMAEAMAEAALAADAGDVPVGCVLVHGGEVIVRAHNLRERAQDPTAHAELIALRAAAAQLGSWRLIGVTCYVTLEPCPMCAGALVNARVPRVVYGCDDPKAGAVRTLFTIGTDPRLNHRFEVSAGVLGEECSRQLSGFFAQVRAGRRGS